MSGNSPDGQHRKENQPTNFLLGKKFEINFPLSAWINLTRIQPHLSFDVRVSAAAALHCLLDACCRCTSASQPSSQPAIIPFSENAVGRRRSTDKSAPKRAIGDGVNSEMDNGRMSEQNCHPSPRR